MKPFFLILFLSAFLFEIESDPVMVDLSNYLNGRWLVVRDLDDLCSTQDNHMATILQFDSTHIHTIDYKENELLNSREFESYLYNENYYLLEDTGDDQFKEEDFDFYMDWGVLRRFVMYDDSMLIFNYKDKTTTYYRLRGEHIPFEDYGAHLLDKKFVQYGHACFDGYGYISYESRLHFISKTHIKYTEKTEGNFTDSLLNYKRYEENFIAFNIKEDTLIYDYKGTWNRNREQKIKIFQYPGIKDNILLLREMELL